MARFEGRHHELREALKAVPANAGFPSPEFVALNDFRFRTSPLMDDLVAAVRELLPNIVFPATSDREQARRNAEAYAPLAQARDRAQAALAALDEASGG